MDASLLPAFPPRGWPVALCPRQGPHNPPQTGGVADLSGQTRRSRVDLPRGPKNYQRSRAHRVCGVGTRNAGSAPHQIDSRNVARPPRLIALIRHRKYTRQPYCSTIVVAWVTRCRVRTVPRMMPVHLHHLCQGARCSRQPAITRRSGAHRAAHQDSRAGPTNPVGRFLPGRAGGSAAPVSFQHRSRG